MPGRERRLIKCSRPTELPPRSLGALRRTRTQEGRVGPATQPAMPLAFGVRPDIAGAVRRHRLTHDAPAKTDGANDRGSVLIVGGGPVGLTASILLSQQ